MSFFLESNVRKPFYVRAPIFALAAVIFAILGGCAVVPVQSGYSYSYGYVETRPAVVVPYGYYGSGYRHYPRHPHYRHGPRDRW